MVGVIDKLNGFVSNASITKPAPVKFVNRKDLEPIMSINAMASMYLVQRLLKIIKIAKTHQLYLHCP